MTPIALFAFNRPESTKELLNSLILCTGFKKTELTVFLDGPRNASDALLISSVIQVIDDFVKSNNLTNVTVVKKETNQGLAKSLVCGINEIFSYSERIIVLEDDLILSKDFLTYMNASLDYYEDHECVGAVSGFSIDIDYGSECDNFFHHRPCSWGWATWKKHWINCDWTYLPRNFKDKLSLYLKCYPVGQDIYRMFEQNHRGKINSWAILWTIHFVRSNLLCSYPVNSRVINQGFSKDATHCKGDAPFPMRLYDSHCNNYHLSRNFAINSKFNFYYSNFYKISFKFSEKLKGWFN